MKNGYYWMRLREQFPGDHKWEPVLVITLGKGPGSVKLGRMGDDDPLPIEEYPFVKYEFCTLSPPSRSPGRMFVVFNKFNSTITIMDDGKPKVQYQLIGKNFHQLADGLGIPEKVMADFEVVEVSPPDLTGLPTTPPEYWKPPEGEIKVRFLDARLGVPWEPTQYNVVDEVPPPLNFVGQVRDKCPKCGSEDTEVEREGMTGTLGRVICSKCKTDIREWDAY